MSDKQLNLDLEGCKDFLGGHEIDLMQSFVNEAHYMLHKKTGIGNEFTGWIDLPKNYDRVEFDRIKRSAKKIRDNSDVFIVIGIGGSYLGARAAIDMLSHTFYNDLPKEKRNGPKIYFLGNSLSSTYIADLLEVIEDKDISVNVISKSGTTTEPAIAFRILRELLEKKYGKAEARNRIFATTDKKNGALKSLADTEGYRTFIIPDDIGGRFSVLTAVGILPIAVAGIDIDNLMKGAEDASVIYSTSKLSENDAYKYAVVRNVLYRKGKTTEILANFEPCLHYFGEWWKQLYGESEGKDHKGLFPASVNFSTDLHSIGQFIQDGSRNLIETFLNVEKPKKDFEIRPDKENLDKLNFIQGKTIGFVNQQAFRATVLAHISGYVPCMVLNIPEISPYYLGHMIYFFEKACGISGYLLGVNPFNQPGVEEYKKNMFAFLEKPGYEELTAKIKERM
ncbi:glucose-6-phosphate isomerase [Clostridium fermenticellae]|uniref:Glucose-6-phosphate isomerase n=1 Tax=Clostridium fermenticellae TaxID=2068654 RepID=A0A386H1S6_9CLOT|nr:glucose-6-phosphate isomerase [Clostridium fermenticellae]AYD39503.1 glucose-6-phosphate isomerase [Clostridium fermenticellae]